MPTRAQATVLKGSAATLARLTGVLRRGGIVAVPTETVYGLAAHALNGDACRRIFEAKGRPAYDPLIVHVASLAQAGELAELNDAARKLAKSFWPGPLTLVLPKKPCVPDIVTSGKPSVAVRMPRHRLFLRLLRASGLPLAAPSANPFGYVSPTTAAHVIDGLGTKIKYVLDGGPCEIGLESTIVDIRDPRRPVILRPGAITAEEVTRCLGTRARAVRRASPKGKAAVAPGMLTRHYSPRTPVLLFRRRPSLQHVRHAPTEAWVFLSRPRGRALPPNAYWLAERSDLAAAAHELFAMLRRLDGAGWKRIHVQQAPDQVGLAAAINDRLRRAAARR